MGLGDDIKAGALEAKGKTEELLGKAIKDRGMRAEGVKDQAKAKATKAKGKAKDAVKKAGKAVEKAGKAVKKATD